MENYVIKKDARENFNPKFSTAVEFISHYK
jgi:hypothetical protein